MSLPVVLIPGLQSDRRSWQFQIPHLQAEGREVIVPTGHYRARSIAEMADIVAAQMPTRAHVVAWSMGGYIACDLLARMPDRVASLAMIATSARPEDAARTEERRAAIAEARSLGIGTAQFNALAVSCVDRAALAPGVVDSLVAAAEDIGADAFEAQQEAIIARADGRPALAAYPGPLTILVGEADVVTPPDRAVEMHALRPDAPLHVIPGAGHCVPLERPEAVNALLSDWLAACEAVV